MRSQKHSHFHDDEPNAFGERTTSRIINSNRASITFQGTRDIQFNQGVKREYTPVPYQTTIASVNASTNTRVDIRSKKNTVEHVDTINNMEPSAKKRNADPHYKAGDNTGRNVNTNTNVKIEVSNIERVVKDDTNDYDGKKSALLDDTSTSSSTNSLRTPKIQSNVVIPVESINPTDEKQIRTGNNKAVADTTTPRMAVTSKGIKDEDKDIIINNNNNKNNIRQYIILLLQQIIIIVDSTNILLIVIIVTIVKIITQL